VGKGRIEMRVVFAKALLRTRVLATHGKVTMIPTPNKHFTSRAQHINPSTPNTIFPSNRITLFHSLFRPVRLSINPSRKLMSLSPNPSFYLLVQLALGEINGTASGE
jgi:hypothetical protein